MREIKQWTPDRVALLRKLHAEGLSYSTIANKLGNVTRNAVWGKCHRLGLSNSINVAKRRTPRIRKPTTRQNPQHKPVTLPKLERITETKPRPTLKQVELPLLDPNQSVKFIEAEHTHCKYIISPEGTPALEIRVCGMKPVIGTSWCETHRAEVFDLPRMQRLNKKLRRRAA